MALPKLNMFKITTVTAVFATTLVVLVLVNGSAPDLSQGGGITAVRSGSSTEDSIRSLRAAVRAHPERVASYSLLGEAYLQRSRETGDPGYLTRAEGILERALERNPRDPGALTTMGALAASRHDFSSALDYGRRARKLAPEVVRPYGVVVDALVELGRFREAGAELQRMVDLKPDLSSYARVSYYRELHGDLDGAIEAMRLAASSGTGAPENTAYVQTLLGNLELARGNGVAARRAYATALDRVAGYVPAQVGLAGLAAADGRLVKAIRSYRDVVSRTPLPEYVIALGEAQLAAGRRTAAQQSFDLARAEQRSLTAGGANTAVELATFEADHGRVARGLTLARRGWRSAPNVGAADALGWALTRSGRAEAGLRYAKRALRLGSTDPLFLYHAGISAKLAGRPAQARAYLTRSLDLNPRFSPLHAPRARQALKSLR